MVDWTQVSFAGAVEQISRIFGSSKLKLALLFNRMCHLWFLFRSHVAGI